MGGHGRERAQRTRAHARDGVLQGRRNERFERPRLEQCIDAAGAARAEVRAHRRKRRARLPELGQRVGDHRGALPALVHSARRSRALPSAAAPLRARGRAARLARASRCGASPRTRTRPPKTGGAAPHHPVSGGTQTRLLLLTGDPETNTTQTLFFFASANAKSYGWSGPAVQVSVGAACTKKKGRKPKPAGGLPRYGGGRLNATTDELNPMYKTPKQCLVGAHARTLRARAQTNKNKKLGSGASCCGAAGGVCGVRGSATGGAGAVACVAWARACRSSAMARAAPSRRCPRS